MENVMNVKGEYKYYVEYDGWNHSLWMVIKYKVDNAKKVYKTKFNITSFINRFNSILFEGSKNKFRRTSRIYADYILNYGVMDMFRFIVCKDIEKKHIAAIEKKEMTEVDEFIQNLTKQKWCEFVFPINDKLNLEDMETEIRDKMYKRNKECQNSRKIKFRKD